ncbi:hypothetical protein OSSY52_07380 [Tepiditoga spiralis]|uniref:Thioredoxin-like fold domain-containing protein n=1 Tax=Tepiditoga spiralis TaxID=2108365 RepID=A0A7G1G6R8_9BACT|nr:thioredoxin family protein [Tepiditoga spiralis]BBE30597.1 hypothetical protein OSSY52_07380 [Tepiditoga spiralis]
MKIKILGSGCPNCNRLEKNSIEALKELGKSVEVEHIRDYGEIMSYGVMRTPALVINEKVVIAGRVAKKDEIKDLLK